MVNGDMRIFLLIVSLVLISGCSSWKQRNIALYEKSLAAEEASSLPPEPTLKKKRPDDVSDESLLASDGLSPAERAIIDRDNKKDQSKAQKRSHKVFGFTPKD